MESSNNETGTLIMEIAIFDLCVRAGYTIDHSISERLGA
jgi:hypothetical protein